MNNSLKKKKSKVEMNYFFRTRAVILNFWIKYIMFISIDRDKEFFKKDFANFWNH